MPDDAKPSTNIEPPTDPQQRIVDGFRKPEDAFLSQANIAKGESIVWGIFLSRHAWRPQRNAHRLLIAKNVAMLTRSEEAYGSREAAEVAKGRAAGPASIFDKLLGQEPPPAEPASSAPATRSASSGSQPQEVGA